MKKEEYKKKNISFNWINLVKPSKCKVIKSNNINICSIKIEPLEKGFGITLANCIRRIMLSSLCGTSISAVKFEGIKHEYTAINGIKEDILEIIFNLKAIVFKGNVGFNSERSILRIKSKGTIKANMIKTNNQISIVNPDFIICNVTKDINLDIEFIISSGKGYVSAKDQLNIKDKNFILIDSLYSPVKRCFFSVEKVRLGSKNKYDSLILNVETNGSITPEMALALSAKILQNQLQIFITFKEVEEMERPKIKKLSYDVNLLRKVTDLELSVRSQNCLKNDNIKYIGDLIRKSEMQMLKTPNFGKKSLNEIKDILKKMNLYFGMNIKDWPPKNIEEKAKIYLNDNI